MKNSITYILNIQLVHKKMHLKIIVYFIYINMKKNFFIIGGAYFLYEHFIYNLFNEA